MDELKPCPFCGGSGYWRQGRCEPSFYIACKKCETIGPATVTLETAITAWNTRAASGGDSASMVLERFGRAPAGSPYLLVPMSDGYWTPWHIAQKALDDSRLNEPSGNSGQLASMEQRARELLKSQYLRSGMPDATAETLTAHVERTQPEALRAITAALANQQGVGRG